jgi:hypothetical protein
VEAKVLDATVGRLEPSRGREHRALIFAERHRRAASMGVIAD